MIVSPDHHKRKRRGEDAEGTGEEHLSPEDLLYAQLLSSSLPTPIRQYPFARAQGRRFRFDFAWPDTLIALEIEGGIWTSGRHTRGAGFTRDITKYNMACLLGWRVFRATSGMVRDGTAFALARQILEMAQKECGEQHA